MAFTRKLQREVTKFHTPENDESKTGGKSSGGKLSDSTLKRLMLLFVILNFVFYFINHRLSDGSDANLRQVVSAGGTILDENDRPSDGSDANLRQVVITGGTILNEKDRSSDGSDANLHQVVSAGVTILNEKAIESVLKSGRKNIALKKIASQSETQKDDQKADNAVDGNREDTMTHTKGCNPWWSVNLERVHDVKDVIIFNQKDSHRDRLSGFSVSVMKKVSGKWEATATIDHVGPAPDIVGFSFEPSAKGERVKVRMEGCDETKFLHMLQVEVYEP